MLVPDELQYINLTRHSLYIGHINDALLFKDLDCYFLACEYVRA
jgi:hypothetical protein